MIPSDTRLVIVLLCVVVKYYIDYFKVLYKLHRSHIVCNTEHRCILSGVLDRSVPTIYFEIIALLKNLYPWIFQEQNTYETGYFKKCCHHL